MGCWIEPHFKCSSEVGETSVCQQYYFPPVCGDRKLDSLNEQCDDGNQVSGDGCSQDCQEEPGYSCNTWGCMKLCGNGMVNPGE